MQERRSNLRQPISRRLALKVGGGTLAAALTAEGVRSLVTAQTVTVTTVSVPSIVQKWINAWNSSNPADSLNALYTSSGIYEDVPTGRKSSPGNISGFLSGFIRELSGINLALTDAFATATWATAEYTFSATNQGTFAGLTGKQFSVRVATIFQVQGNLIQRSSDYYDLGTIAAQLAPPPATPVPATPAPATIVTSATVPASPSVAPPPSAPATVAATRPSTVPATPATVPATPATVASTVPSTPTAGT